MIAYICLCIPPMIMVNIRGKIIKKTNSKYKIFLDYVVSLLLINFSMLAILSYGFHNDNNLFYKLNQYNNFAVKYIFCSVLLAVIEPYAEMFIRERVTIKFKKFCGFPMFTHWKLVVGIYAIILFLLNFIRIFDNNFWADEAFTATFVQNTVWEIINTTATDVHPPLYYLFAKVFYVLFGNQGWAFHLLSLIPCAIIMVLAMTIFWKEFGKETAVILITLIGLSDNAVQYNVEVRMYSWGLLFILLSYYGLYNILQNDSIQDYVLFVISSISSAYIHYYCLVAVAFFYLCILYLNIFRKRLSSKRVWISCICTIVAYLPWVINVLRLRIYRKDSFWWSADIPTAKESIRYLFSDQFDDMFFLIFAIGLVFVFLYETGMLVIEKHGKWVVSFSFSYKDIKSSNVVIWILAGISSILGTIFLGIIISKMIVPLFIFRYIYPVSIVAWMILGITVSRLKGKKVYMAIMTAIMIIIFLPKYYNRYNNEKIQNDKLQETLAATVDEIKTDDIILTNRSHISWTIAQYYYPRTTAQLINTASIPELVDDKCYWLIAYNVKNMDEVYTQLEEKDFGCEQVVTAGHLGTHTVDIYRIEKKES